MSEDFQFRWGQGSQPLACCSSRPYEHYVSGTLDADIQLAPGDEPNVNA